EVRVLDDGGRALLRRYAYADDRVEVARIAQALECRERVEIGRVVAGVQRAARTTRKRLDGPSLVERDGRPDLEDLASPMRRKPDALRLGGDLVDTDASCAFVRRAAPVVRDDRPLVLHANAQRPHLARVG